MGNNFAYDNTNIYHHHKSNSLPHGQDGDEDLMQEEQLMGEHEGMHDGGTGGGKASELIIRPIEGKQTNFYYIKESGGKIGRHSVNEVVIYDESVSRHHAEITFMDNEFFLQDIGSTTGTYIKIEERLPLEPGMILEIGSYQFRVKNIVINKKAPNNGSPMMTDEASENDPSNQSHILFDIYDGPEDFDQQEHILLDGSTIGRKKTCTLCFCDDMHMSIIHCKMVSVHDCFYIEDMSSTNGTWLRLSKEGEKSKQIMIKDNTTFKVGNTNIYNAKRVPQDKALEGKVDILNSKSMTEREGNCFICYEKERDCLLMPCKHNISCIKCSQSFKTCPVCRHPIDDLVRIFKN